MCLYPPNFRDMNDKRDKDKEITLWVEQYSEPLLNRAFYLLSDRTEAMDMVQEVFLTAHLAYDNFQSKCEPLTWLHSILRRKVADFYRYKYRGQTQTISLDHFFDESGSWIDSGVAHPWEEEIDTSKEKEELQGVFDDCLNRLPMKWKLLVKLYYLQEKTSSDICQELDLTKTNLWKILQRCRLQLRECLETNWFEYL